ncbi:unnamed protein product [Adineta steineri]|uniref:tRNA (guanine(26)-N(2))-dimethyltransferase n=1 Tax=Adineta steineri TaxID=433720 RepID=A0A813WWT7_9BILA|nr:unnamed protein product [Adineta steineri]CAF0861722.1 unnamed protein product [Adineta steineri]
MIFILSRIRVDYFLIRTSILNRRLSNLNINDEDYSLSTIMTDSVQVKEGKANIRLPEGAVFYNPAQVFNRDLSVACLRLVSKYHHENECKRMLKNDPNATCVPFDQLTAGVRQENGLKIAEALSATGLRSVRYAREIPGIDTIYANDIDAGAVESIKQNIELNDVKNLVQPSHDDAMSLLYNHRKIDEQFHVVDLDPYGTPAQFLDGAVQCIKKNGVICITATDMASLCGNNPHSCYSKYGSIPLHQPFCHEFALRMILYTLHLQAARYDRIIEPLLCMSIDFYVRLFVRINYGAAKAQSQLGDIATVYNCIYCTSFYFQPYGQASLDERGNAKFKYAHGPPVGTTCSHCGSNLRVGGPIWLGPLFDHSFVGELITSIEQAPEDSYAYRERMLSMLHVVQEELPDPLYFDNGKLAQIMHTQMPQNKILRSALLNAGYKVSTTHARQDAIKTNAPHAVIWDIMRAFGEQSPTKRAATERLNTETPYYRLLTKPSTIKVDFTEHPDWESEARKNKLIRFLGNPHARWGPLGKAVTKKKRSSDEIDSTQNKKQTKSDADSSSEENV